MAVLEPIAAAAASDADADGGGGIGGTKPAAAAAGAGAGANAVPAERGPPDSCAREGAALVAADVPPVSPRAEAPGEPRAAMPLLLAPAAAVVVEHGLAPAAGRPCLPALTLLGRVAQDTEKGAAAAVAVHAAVRIDADAASSCSSTPPVIPAFSPRPPKSPNRSPRRVSFDSRRFVCERVDVGVARRYEIERRELGIGGYGKVYLAKDRVFKDRLVAIKKVNKRTAYVGEAEEEEENQLESLLREVEIMKDLDHPCICRLFETYAEGESMFFVMEYCAGGDLFDRFMHSGTIAERLVAEITSQVASALKYAHGRGIAHRDLKLENICFVNRDPRACHVKVIDWGLGRYFGASRMKSNVGSMTFSAPEVLNHEAGNDGYTSACDIWSLGVIAYVVLCGRPPFSGSIREQLRQMRREQFSMDGPAWAQISSGAADFIRAVLRNDTRDRASLDTLLRTPWLTAGRHAGVDTQDVASVLRRVERFRQTSDFFSLCAASVARQGDHSTLEGLGEIFCMLDRNCDGVLDLEELRDGFRSSFGDASNLVHEVEDIFMHLDLDGTGRITYTEFCAAALDENSYRQQHMLWAAFKTFDIRDDGQISLEELQQVLKNADVKRVRKVAQEVASREVAQEVMEEFGNSDGNISFQEWLLLMQEHAGLEAN